MPTAREVRIAEVTTDLAGVREAIRRIITGGQAYSADGRAMTRADLNALIAREKDLAAELTRLQRSAATRVYGVVYR